MHSHILSILSPNYIPNSTTSHCPLVSPLLSFRFLHKPPFQSVSSLIVLLGLTPSDGSFLRLTWQTHGGALCDAAPTFLPNLTFSVPRAPAMLAFLSVRLAKLISILGNLFLLSPLPGTRFQNFIRLSLYVQVSSQMSQSLRGILCLL